MGGVYCPRCLTNVIIESDGHSCSNCGEVIVMPAPRRAQPEVPPAKEDTAVQKPKARHRSRRKKAA